MNDNTKQMILGISIAVFGFAGILGLLLLGGYPTYLSDVGNQHACETTFGENATYVGKTGAGYTTQRGALCQTNDGLRIIESQTAPMNWDTFNGYLSGVFDGEY